MVTGKGLLKQPLKNIVVRMPNWLGDLVMATPVVADLRKQWPDVHMTVMCQANVASVLQEDPHIDELHTFHRQSPRDMIKALRREHYDLGILLTHSFSSAWWFWRGGVKYSIGYSGRWRNRLLSKAVLAPKNKERQHQVVTYKMLIEELGIPISDRAPYLYLTEKEIDSVTWLLRRFGVTEKHLLVGVNPGAAYGSAKCWLPSRFRLVTQQLLENPLIRVVYFGDAKGAPVVNDICTGMPERVINLAGRTSIRELMALIKSCHVMLTNDSGPMHIAAAVGTPLVALFGSTNEVKTGPYNHGRIIHKHTPCSPCYKRKCPYDFQCMKGIDVDAVYKELQFLIRHSLVQ